MKKIFAIMSIIISLIIFGGCNSTNNNMNNEQNNNTNQEQEEQLYISTLEGVWRSEKGKLGEFAQIVCSGNSIKGYTCINQFNESDLTLEWACIYVPITSSSNEWTFNNDESCNDERSDLFSKTIRYSDGVIYCIMQIPFGGYGEISFTKVSD